MATWGELLDQINSGRWNTPEGMLDVDGMRRTYIAELAAYTGRATVVYATDFLNSAKQSPDMSIDLGDVQGLMEVFKGLEVESGLDLILHSPGGDPTAADSLVRYIRERFKDVRVIVPLAAMSAATMWSLAADVIVMGRHSQLGPIDPQINFGRGMVPAGAIERNFKRAQDECAADPARLSGWVPTLQQYFPGLLEMCDQSAKLSKALVADYLEKYMFRRRPNKKMLAEAAADFFADDTKHMTHGRGIGREQVRSLGVKVLDLEKDSKLQDAVLTVFHSYAHTFGRSNTVKIIENHLGRAWVKGMPVPMGLPMGMPITMMPTAPTI